MDLEQPLETGSKLREALYVLLQPGGVAELLPEEHFVVHQFESTLRVGLEREVLLQERLGQDALSLFPTLALFVPQHLEPLGGGSFLGPGFRPSGRGAAPRWHRIRGWP